MYIYELWLGRATGYWNWEFKGIDEDDYATRISACDNFIQEIKNIKEYYERQADEQKREVIE